MKRIILCLIVLSGLFSIACQQKVESSPVALKDPQPEAPAPVSTPETYDEISVSEMYSNEDRKIPRTLLKFQRYQIKRVPVKKTDDIDSPVATIYDAVLSKNNKQITRFEGTYWSPGNQMSFGLYPFLGGKEKQLLVFDESLHYEHDWIVKLSPNFEEIYDSEEFDVNGLSEFDIDHDGILELRTGKAVSMGFMFSRAGEPVARIIFKYDPQSRKYQPATHLFPQYVLDGYQKEGFAEQLKNFNARPNNRFSEFLLIFMKYIYAGQETEAWKFFDANFSTDKLFFEGEKDRENTRGKIIAALEKDKIYQYIKADLIKDK